MLCSFPVQKYRKLLSSPWRWHGCWHHTKSFIMKFLLCGVTWRCQATYLVHGQFLFVRNRNFFTKLLQLLLFPLIWSTW